MSFGIVYHDEPGAGLRPLWGVLVETRTGRAWSPSAGAFVAEPADPYLPFSPLAVPDVDFGGAHRLWVDAPAPWDDAEYYLSIHTVRGGPPVGRTMVFAPGYVGFGVLTRLG